MILTKFLSDFTRVSLSGLSSLLEKDKNHFSITLRGHINIKNMLSLLKYSSLIRANSLAELTAVDNPRKELRFTILYFLVSIEYNFRLLIKLLTPNNYVVSSTSTLYLNANWSEREVRDMFGIFFIDNFDLRRLLTDYGFQGFPLRKDFPLSGYVETRYDDETQRILYEPVQLTQEFRNFSLSNPWERVI